MTRKPLLIANWKMNKNINTFKWKDYLETVNLTYAPHHIPTLYSRDKLLEITARKVKFKPLSSIATSILLSRQSGTIKKVKNTFLSLTLFISFQM